MKPYLKALIAAGALAALVAVLMILQNRPEPKEDPGGDENQLTVITDESAVVGMTLENRHGALRFYQKDEAWLAEGREYAKLAYEATAMALTMDGLVSRETLEAPSNLAEFGLSPPAAVLRAEHESGAAETVLLGSRGVTGHVYYCMVEGGADVYLINGVAAERLLYEFSAFREKALPKVNAELVSRLYVKNEREEIELASADPDSERDQFGMPYLQMRKPYEGRGVYDTTLKDSVYAYLDGVSQIGAFVEDNAKDFSPYGLDEPGFVFQIDDADGGGLHLLFGSDAPDGGVYFRVSGEPHVYSMPKANVEPLMALRGFYLADRFVAIYGIADVESVVIDDDGVTWVLSMEYETVGDAVTETFKLNGVATEDTAFRQLYQKVVGIQGDAPIEEEITPPGQPEVTITYHFIDGRPPATVALYPYDSRLYAAGLDGALTVFSSRRYVEDLRKALREM